MRAIVTPITDPQGLRDAWLTLETNAEPSFFTSWHWIEALLVAAGRTAFVLKVMDDNRIVGLCVLYVHSAARRRWFTPRDTLSVNETGDPVCDAIYIEHNGILHDRRYGAAVVRAALACLSGPEARSVLPRFDEIRLGGVPEIYRMIAAEIPWLAREIARKPTFGVDLAALRQSGEELMAQFGRNTRHQIRRSIRAYERHGPLGFNAAPDLETALFYFEQMIGLHTARWTERGQSGAFATTFARTFHTALIRGGITNGSVELVECRAGDTVIGYLYNFVYRGTVYFYQSGFEYSRDRNLKPGLVTHYLCMERHLSRGNDYYDFMAGEQRYKTNLAARGKDLIWLRLRRPLWQYRFADAASRAMGIARALCDRWQR